LYGLKRSRTFC